MTPTIGGRWSFRSAALSLVGRRHGATSAVRPRQGVPMNAVSMIPSGATKAWGLVSTRCASSHSPTSCGSKRIDRSHFRKGIRRSKTSRRIWLMGTPKQAATSLTVNSRGNTTFVGSRDGRSACRGGVFTTMCGWVSTFGSRMPRKCATVEGRRDTRCEDHWPTALLRQSQPAIERR